uniref:protein-histidine N-methyltransferase n=1 Tax=Ditylenchus dipsaci TaxID=166011 RepID=A0A915ELW8_9BILA
MDQTRQNKRLEKFLKWSSEMAIRHDGVDITSSGSGYLSLTVSKGFDKEALVVDVPREAVLSLDFADQCFSLRVIFENDEMIKAMDNVGLVMVLAHEILIGEQSSWSAYLNILPNSFTTPLFYTLEQLQTLKPSPIFEDALNMYRSVARQFVYFYLRIMGDSKHVNKKNRLNTAEKAPFLWVLLRQITLVSSSTGGVCQWYQLKSGKQPDLVPSLIPFIDLANHGQSAFESVNTALQPNQEVLIYYGVRNNLKFLLHNGFVPPLPNPYNTYEIKFGLPKSTDCEFKVRYLKEHHMMPYTKNVYHFVLEPCQYTLHASFLLQFGCAFVAQTQEQLENGVEHKAKNL